MFDLGRNEVTGGLRKSLLVLFSRYYLDEEIKECCWAKYAHIWHAR